MRTVMFATLAVFAAVLANAAPASAAWTCTGPAFACDEGKSSANDSKPSYSKSAKKHSASHKTYASKPRKAAKVASYDNEDETPVRKGKGKAKRTAHYSGGGESFGGKASYYWQPQRLASGGWFNPNAMTAAHKTLPFGTKVRVTNRHNGQSVVVTINDRGPYVAGRVIDLSSAAAGAISMKGAGVVPVSVAVLGR